MRLLRTLPRLITFDSTGTLLSTQIPKHYVEVAKCCGYDNVERLDATRLEKQFRASFKRLEAGHPIYGRHTGLGWENWWRALVREVFLDQDRDIERGLLDKIADTLIAYYGTRRCWSVYPGTLELLNCLSQRRPDLVVGVVSNYDERLSGILESAGLRAHFDFVLTSYGFGIAKPNRSVFEEALRLASLGRAEPIGPHEALHVGDRLDNDYAGARDAGWSAILVDRASQKIEDPRLDPVDVVADFDELRKRFEKSFGDQNIAQGR